MAEIFKCGDIANIINNDSKRKVKNKKKTTAKLSKVFNEMIEENKNRVIEIAKIDETIAKHQTNSDNEMLINVNENDSESETDIKTNNKNRKKTKKKSDSTEKTERTLFVGNLPINITPKNLKKMFKNFGKIQSIRLRGAAPVKEKMPKKVAIITKRLHSGKDNIHAYIVFKSNDDVIKALELNGVELEGHHIRVDRACDRENHDQSRSVFLGNLPFTVKEDQLYDFFKECGEIKAVRVVRDPKTGIGKGFGFISFDSKDSVVLALEKNQQDFKGRELRIVRAKNETKINKQKQSDDKKQSKHKSNEKSPKNNKKSDSKPEFEGLSAKKIKPKTNKKKAINSLKSKKKKKNLAEILSH